MTGRRKRRSRVPRRTTWQQTAILAELGLDTTFRSAQEIHTALSDAGQEISLATVYRNLQKLRESANVDVVLSQDGETLYRLCEDDDHHHHLVCEVCGATEEVRTGLLERAIDSLARDHGYTLRKHRVELYGLCPNCRQ